MSRITSKRRQRKPHKPAIEPIALSDESRLILRAVWRTFQDNAVSISATVSAINANTQRCLDELAKTLAAREGVDLNGRALDCQAEQWVARPPEGANNGKMA